MRTRLIRYAFFASLVWLDVSLDIQGSVDWEGIIIREKWIGKGLEGSDRGMTWRTVPVFSFECFEENHELLMRLYKARSRFAHDYLGVLRFSHAVTPEMCSCHFLTHMAVLIFLWDLNAINMEFNWFNVGTIHGEK
jgi:hypothetical protein